MRLGKLRYDSKFIAIKFFYETKNWSINWMCKQLEISRAAYYKWLHREIPKKEAENMKLAEFIKEYDERFNHILGYRRMTSWINHFNHTDYKPKRVHRIMKKLGIHSVIRKKKKKYTSSAPESIAENKLGRDFYACAPNEKWATDVTEFKVPTTTNLYLKPLIKRLLPIRRRNHSFTVTEDSNTPAKYFKRNSRNTRWNNQCHELVAV